jgi:hypothetical protein
MDIYNGTLQGELAINPTNSRLGIGVIVRDHLGHVIATRS